MLCQVGVGALIFHQSRVLMVQRGRAPFKGFWSVPGGRQRNDESLFECAVREVFEETCIVVEPERVCHAFQMTSSSMSHPFIIVDVLAHYKSGTVNAMDDAADAKWLSAKQVNNLYNGGNGLVEDETMGLLRQEGFV